jgi:large subunit ribosomal protein L4e
MKTTLFDSTGKKKSEMELPAVFNTRIREDIVQKYFEAEKLVQPYAPYSEAGRRHSASGTISHKRHDWKGHYGRGISRVPRKTMWRRGTQFFWIGAEVSGARGGRRAHPPKGIGKEKKINKKEIQIAMSSALASTSNKEYIISRYQSISKIDLAPAIIESLPEKTKQLKQTLNSIFPNLEKIIFRNYSTRAGVGKLRGRKYKSNAGILIVTSENEYKQLKGFDIVPINELSIADLFPLGRIALFTQKAIGELK